LDKLKEVESTWLQNHRTGKLNCFTCWMLNHHHHHMDHQRFFKLSFKQDKTR